MLEVGTPEKPAHSWREFLIQIGTICIGLLLAVVVEQTVEAIVDASRANRLRGYLKAESQQVLVDGRQALAVHEEFNRWVIERMDQVKRALWENQSLANVPNPQPANYDSPDIPIWRSAKASGQTPLLTKGEINAYSEVEYVQSHVEVYEDRKLIASRALRAFEHEFFALPGGEPDLSKAGPEDRRRYLSLLSQVRDAVETYSGWVAILLQTEEAVLAGKTDPKDIRGLDPRLKALNDASVSRQIESH